MSAGQVSATYRADLIARPMQVPRNHERGTETFFLTGTGNSLVALARFRASPQMSYEDLGWAALLHGHPLPVCYWFSSISEAESNIAQIGLTLGVHCDPEAGPCLGEDTPDLIAQACDRRCSTRLEGEIRRRLHKDRFAEFLIMMVEAAFGAYRSAEMTAAHDTDEAKRICAVIGRGAGISTPSKKKKTEPIENDPWAVQAGELESMISLMSSESASPRPEPFPTRRARDTQSAAVELMAIILKLSSIESVQRHFRKKSSPALALISFIAAGLTPTAFFIMVAIWKGLRRIPEIGNGALEFLACEPPQPILAAEFGSQFY